MVNLDFNVLVFLTGFVFALPIIGYLFRFNIPISIFFLLAGTFMIAIFLATDGIILDYTPLTNSTIIQQVLVSNTTNYHYVVETSNTDLPTHNGTGAQWGRSEGLKTTAPFSILEGDVLQCIDLYLAKVGSPPSPDTPQYILVGVWTVSNTDPTQIYGAMPAPNLTTTLTFYTFCVPEGSERTLQNGDRIGFQYRAGNSTNYVLTRSSDVAGGVTFDGTHTVRVNAPRGSGFTTGVDTGDIVGRFYDFEIEYATIEDFDTTIEDQIMDISFTGENFQIKVIMIFISVMFLVGGTLVEVRQR